MNKRQVIIIWIVAIVLGAAVALVKFTSKETTSFATTRAPGQTLFPTFPAAEVSSLEITGADGSATIAKKDGKWTVTQRDDYPANGSTVNEFLRTLGELKVTRAMEAGPSFAPRFGMDESSSKAEDRGLTATFRDASGKEIAKVSLGKNIETAASASPMGGGMSVGRYVRNHADESGFYAVSEMFSSIQSDPVRWLATDFFSPEKIRSITLSQPDKDETAWKVTRETEEAEFKLENAAADELLETSAGSSFKTLFSYLRFDDVIPADKVTERAATEGKRTATIETFEGFTYNLTITPAKSAAPQPAPNPDEAPPPSSENVLLTLTVSAELPKERKKEENEKPEDAKTKDDAFNERLKTLTEKLAKEKAFEGRTFLLAKSSVDSLIKERDALVTKATPPAADGSSATPAVQELPGGIIAPAPPDSTRTATTPPIEAVTPPIAIPPLPDEEKPADEPAGGAPNEGEAPDESQADGAAEPAKENSEDSNGSE